MRKLLFLFILSFPIFSWAQFNFWHGNVNKCSTVRSSCLQHLTAGCTQSGFYKINVQDSGNVTVYCEQKIAGGGWTVVAVSDIESAADYPVSVSDSVMLDPLVTNNQSGYHENWPKYTQFAAMTNFTTITPTDSTLIPRFYGPATDNATGVNGGIALTNNYVEGYNTNSFGSVNCNIIKYINNTGNLQNGKCAAAYINNNATGYPAVTSGQYYPYKTIYGNTMIYDYWGQIDIMPAVINSSIFKVSSQTSRFIDANECGTGWVTTSCRQGTKSFTMASSLIQKFIFMVR